MSRILKNGVLAHFGITVFDTDGETPKTALVNTDFSKLVTLDGAVNALAVTVTEINASTRPGEYDVSFTPNANGYWRIRVTNATYAKSGFVEDFDVTDDGVLTLSAIKAYLDANSTKLANLDATISSRLAASGYTVPPTVAAIRTEMDANSTKLANLDAAITSRMAAGSVDVGSLQAAALNAIRDAVAGIDIDTKTLQQALRYIASTTVHKSSGDPSGPVTFKGLDGVTDRVRSTMDASGNRTSVVLDP